MNEILKKRIEEAGQAGSLHYNPETSTYSQGKQVGYLRGFNAGAEYALSNQWISVDEALPEAGIKVLVYDIYGFISMAYFSNKSWKDECGSEVETKFWMPIPEMEE